MSWQTIPFLVTSYSYKKKAGKSPVFKVHLTSSLSHSLTLASESKAIYDGFPIGDTVDVKVGRAQQVLIDIPEEGGEE